MIAAYIIKGDDVERVLRQTSYDWERVELASPTDQLYRKKMVVYKTNGGLVHAETQYEPVSILTTFDPAFDDEWTDSDVEKMVEVLT